MRCRSLSCAESAWAAPVARSASSRSSMVLYVVISAAVSEGPETGARTPGRSRSADAMACPSRWSGMSPTRSTTALAASSRASPPRTTTTSPCRTGVDTVTGPSSSAVATTRPAALSEKIRQNSDTVRPSLLSYDARGASLAGPRRSRISVTSPISPPYGDLAACEPGTRDHTNHKGKKRVCTTPEGDAAAGDRGPVRPHDPRGPPSLRGGAPRRCPYRERVPSRRPRLLRPVAAPDRLRGGRPDRRAEALPPQREPALHLGPGPGGGAHRGGGRVPLERPGPGRHEDAHGHRRVRRGGPAPGRGDPVARTGLPSGGRRHPHRRGHPRGRGRRRGDPRAGVNACTPR